MIDPEAGPHPSVFFAARYSRFFFEPGDERLSCRHSTRHMRSLREGHARGAHE
jgi:hypothetical protein